ncbi:unnamed protein product [Bemisia tabaci]|uniref:Uncharacterized protein n=1 Tax=Bemisia tabaci TaxID=7038 RepID=A0A9P0EYR4_BEMTA|nr:unnamed protein product [Bemisia tabaci]
MAYRKNHVSLLLVGLVLWVASDRIYAFTITFPGKISWNDGNVIIRGNSVGGAAIALKEGALVVGGTTICESYTDVVAGREPIYQKSPDGSSWYANVKVGEPMSYAEIQAFEAKWPKFAQGRDERVRKALQAARDPNWGAALARPRPARDAKRRSLGGFFTSFWPFSGWW